MRNIKKGYGMRKGYTTTELVTVIFAFILLAVLVAVAYAGIHFVMKFW